MSVTQILVVDDFLAWQHFVSVLLRGESDLQIISSVSDGLEAVRKTKEIRPDLILMDLSLPVMNGIAATRQIRAHAPATKVLFLSEHRESDLIQTAFDVGACGYVFEVRFPLRPHCGHPIRSTGSTVCQSQLDQLARESERQVLGASYSSADGN